MEIGMVGRIVIYHLTREDQAKAGGRHTIGTGKDMELKVAPAIVTFDKEPANEKPHMLSLKVLCDSRDTIWVEANYGPGNGCWEYKGKNEFGPETDLLKRGTERLKELSEINQDYIPQRSLRQIGMLTEKEFENLKE